MRRLPTQDRSKRTVDFLCEAAWQELAVSETLSPAMVAKRAGFDVKTFYEYFPGAPALVAVMQERLVAELGERILESTRAAVKRAEPTRTAMKEIVRIVMELGERGALLVRMNEHDMPHRRDVAWVMLRQFDLAVDAALRSALSRQTTLRLEGRNISVVSRMLVTACGALALHGWSRAQAEGDSRDDYEEEFTHLLTAYLTTPREEA